MTAVAGTDAPQVSQGEGLVSGGGGVSSMMGVTAERGEEGWKKERDRGRGKRRQREAHQGQVTETARREKGCHGQGRPNTT